MDEELLDLNELELARARARARTRTRAPFAPAVESFEPEMTGAPQTVPTVPRRAPVTAPAPARATAPAREMGMLQRGAGGASVALGPLFRSLVSGMAAAGSPGQRPSMTSTPSQRAAEAERALLAAEDEFVEQSPVMATLTGLGGAVPRYMLSAAVPGGPLMLGAAESMASRPQESLPGLLATGAGLMGAPRAQERLQRVAEDPLGRTVADMMLGETIGLPFRAYGARQARRAANAYRAADGSIPMGGPSAPPRRAIPSATAVITPEQVPVTGPPIPTAGVPSRMALPSGAPVERITDPRRLLAEVASSLQEGRQSPFAPGAPQGPAIPLGSGPRQFVEPIGPEVAADPDLTARIQRLMEVITSPSSQTAFRNPETNRMAMLGGAAATRRGPDVPMIARSGGEPERMLVPKQNRPGEVVGAVQARVSRMLGDLLEGRTNIEGSPMGVEASPAFLANTPLRTIYDEAAAPLTPPVRQTPETRMQFGVATGPENLVNPPFSPVRSMLEGTPAATTTTRLDPGAFPYLVNRRAGGRGFVPRRATGDVDPTMGGQFVFDRPLSERVPAVTRAADEGAARGGAMVEGAEDVRSPSMQEMDFLSDAPDYMGDLGENLSTFNREGFTRAQMLEALARAGVGGAGGGIVGGAMGETPEERRAFARAGFGIGMGLGGASGFIGRQSAQTRRINEALDAVRTATQRRREASPTARPFSASAAGATPGISRETITGAPGVGAAQPTPVPRTAGEPLVRPTTVRAKDEPRLQRLNLSPETQDIWGPRIRALSAEIEKTGKQTWGQLKNEAAKLMNTRAELLADIDPKRMTGAEGLAIASIIGENGTNLERLAKGYDAALKPPAGQPVNQALVDQIAGQMNDLEAQTQELLAVFMKGTSAQGRALQANRVLANLTTDPTYWIVKGQRVKGSEALTAEQMSTITRLANAGPEKKEELLKYLSSLRRTGILGQVAQVRRAGLLTGLTGRAYDLVGTGLNFVVEGAQRPLAAGIDRIASALATTKVGGTTAANRSLLAQSPLGFKRTIQGLPEGMRKAAESLGYGTLSNPKQFAKFMREAELDEATRARYDIPQGVNITMFGTSKPGEALNTVADTYQKFVMRLSGATDKLYRTMIFNGAMEEQARLVATREGLTGKRAQVRARQLLANPTDVMRANAMYQAELITFTNEGSIANSVGRMLEAGATGMEKSRTPGLAAKMGELARGLFNIVIPFRRTPSNILTRVSEYTPGLGYLMTAQRVQNWWGDLALLSAAQKAGDATGTEAAAAMASQRKLVQSLTRNISGAGIMALGTWMYEQGILTGDQPRDQKEAEQWRTEGRMPNAVMLPTGEWVSVSRLAPLGTVLAVAANYAQEGGGSGVLERPGEFTGSAMRTVLDQPMLTGPKETLDALTGRDDWKRESFMENMAGSMVPSGIASAARASGEQRTPGSMGEAIRMRIPGLEEGVPVRRNIFGEPLERARGYLLPTMRDQRRTDPLVAEMARVGAMVGAMSKGKDETAEMYDYRTQTAGRAVRAAMENVMSSPEYQQATPEGQREMLEDAARQTRSDFSRWLKDTYNIKSP